MANTDTIGEPSIKFEPLRYCGSSSNSVLLAHSYRKYIRINPNSISQVSAHGGTSKYAQWKLHAMSKNIFKLQNLQSNKYLRIINNGKTIDVGGGGGKFTLFKVIQNNLCSNNMIQPHQISLESIQFPGFYLAVNGKCNVYSYNINNSNGNKNDIQFYLYAKPQINNYEKKESELINVLKPGIVAIQHSLNKHLRVKPGNEINANAEGGRGKFAQWQLEIHGLNLVKFKSTKSGRYLRITNNGTVCNVGGGGGIYTFFKYDPIAKTLESNKFPGFYLAVHKNNKCDVHSINKSMNNDNNYLFEFNIIHLNIPKPDKNNNSIAVIQHAFNKHLRVTPNNEGAVNGNGGRGKFARWNIEYFDQKTKIKLKSTKSGKYLRIIKNGSAVDVGGSGGKFTLFKYNSNSKTLESNLFPGFFLGVNQNNNTVISVQPHAIVNNPSISMQFNIISIGNKMIRGGGNGKGGFNSKYNFSNGVGVNTVVIIRSDNYRKSLRVKPGQLEISNCLGGCGGYARWNITNHGNGIYKLQNTNNGSMKYIRVSPSNNSSEIDVRGTGGKYTQWRVKVIRDINVVVFESVVFSNKYLAVDGKGNVYVYSGNGMNNKECMFSVWMRGNGSGNINGDDKDKIIENQRQLIEQQKAFIDQLQRTVIAQQSVIDNLNGNNNNNGGYPVLGSNINNNGTETNNGENDDGFEYVSNPGCSKKY